MRNLIENFCIRLHAKILGRVIEFITRFFSYFNYFSQLHHVGEERSEKSQSFGFGY